MPRKPRTKAASKPEKGRLNKVIGVGDDGNPTSEWSQQLPVDPFSSSYKYAGLQEPPFPLEQLVFLAEQHPTHAAALEQKSVDVIGMGWEWIADEEVKEKQKDDGQRDQLDEWFKSLSSDNDDSDLTTHEVLTAAWLDVETVGQGLIELARDPSGKLRYWFDMPAHTCRFHRDGLRVAQIRQNKRVWFKKWIPGDDRQVDRVTGRVAKKGQIPQDHVANEVFVLKRPSRRSTWYGVPTYIPATGWITLSTAARDDNIMFFENRREPRWAIVMENVEDDPEIEAQLRKALQVDLKEPHRNLLLPLSGPAKVTFQKLGDNKGDLSWDKLQDRADIEILIAHRMPGERLGIVRQGALGGNAVGESVKVYKESFISSSQALLAARVNKLIAAESGISDPRWEWVPSELDLTEEELFQEMAVAGFQGGVYSLNEAREKAGEEPLDESDERGAKFFFELAPQLAAAGIKAAGAEESAGIRSGKGTGVAAGGDLAAAAAELKDHIQTLRSESDSSG